MSTIKALYGTNNQAITCTLASLASAAARASSVVDNTVNLFLDALVVLKVKTGATGVSTTGYVAVYAYGTVDGGTTYPEGITGTDGAVTLTVPTNLRLIGIINTVANATTYASEPMSVAAAFGGVLPDHWGIVVVNSSGAALDVTEANHAKLYQGMQAQSV
jgi:hypothetical protein